MNTEISAVYARKSTEQSTTAEEAKSITRQQQRAREFAARHGWGVPEELIFCDDGVSGAEFENRPALQALLRTLTPWPPFAHLILMDTSRLGRESWETGYVVKRILQAGVRLWTYLDGREITVEDKLRQTVTGLVDDEERDRARRRTRDALLHKARQGHVTGGTVFGYRNVEIRTPDGKRSHVERIVIPEEAAVVRRIFELCAAGVGLRSIAIRLNDEGAPAPLPRRPGRSRSWAPSSIRTILHNELYCGVVWWGRTQKRDRWGAKKSTPRSPEDWTRLDKPELRIVSDGLWEAARHRLRQARYFSGRTASAPGGAKYLLSGLAACTCGSAMIALSRASGAGRRFVYSCGYHHTRGRSVCDNALLAPMEATDQAVLGAVARDVLNPRVVARAAEQAIAILCPPADAVDERRDELLAQMRRLEAELARLAEAIARGGDVPALLRAVKDREAQRARCEHWLGALESARHLSRFERGRIDRQVREVLTDWQGLLTRHTPQAREILRNVLAGRIIFTPAPEERVYTFIGQGALGRLLAGAIPAYSGTFNSDGGPNGKRPKDCSPAGDRVRGNRVGRISSGAPACRPGRLLTVPSA